MTVREQKAFFKSLYVWTSRNVKNLPLLWHNVLACIPDNPRASFLGKARFGLPRDIPFAVHHMFKVCFRSGKKGG